MPTETLINTWICQNRKQQIWLKQMYIFFVIYRFNSKAQKYKLLWFNNNKQNYCIKFQYSLKSFNSNNKKSF